MKRDKILAMVIIAGYVYLNLSQKQKREDSTKRAFWFRKSEFGDRTLSDFAIDRKWITDGINKQLNPTVKSQAQLKITKEHENEAGIK